MLALLAVPWWAGGSASADQGTPDNTLGVRLLDAPANRYGDPRAQNYIVDHVAPGAVVRRRMSIENSSPVPQHVEVFAGAAAINDNTFDAMAGRVANELTSWISVDHSAVDLRARGSALVWITIAVAHDAAEGEQYGVVWAETSASSSTSDNILMVSRVGIRVYLDVGVGGERPSNFQVSGITPARTADGQPEALADVRNSGGRALDIAGELSLSEGPGGAKAGPFPLTAGATILPGHTASVRALLAKGLPDGPWEARLTLRSGLVERTVTATLTFPSAAGAVGAPVEPDSWVTEALVLLGVLAAVVLAYLAARFWLVRHRTRALSAAPR